MSGYSKIRSALINPKKALSYLFLGKEKFHALRNLSEHSCFQIESSSILESYMTHPTDIHEHLQTLYMLTIELNLKNTLELGTRTGESTVSLLLAAKEVNGKVTSIDIDSCNDAKEKVKKWALIYKEGLVNNINTYDEMIHGDIKSDFSTCKIKVKPVI